MSRNRIKKITIDRRLSGIADAPNPVTAGWRVFFRLSPRPYREWDDCFERIRTKQEAQLNYQYRLVPESRPGSYVYGSSRRRFGYSLRTLFGRRLAYGVEVICPATAEDLQRATNELATLVGNVNRIVNQSAKAHAEAVVAARIASDRLHAAVRGVEKQLKVHDLKAGKRAPEKPFSRL
jgi:hypothetical protein